LTVFVRGEPITLLVVGSAGFEPAFQAPEA
jgi:hypothetical protein